jgi:hypothetical protein
MAQPQHAGRAGQTWAQTWARVIAEIELEPVWAVTLAGLDEELRAEGQAGERLIGWTVRQFKAGPAQAAVSEDSSAVEWPVFAARLFQERRERHEPLPDFQGWSWDELVDWAREETHRFALRSWSLREPVFEFPDGWTVEMVRDDDDQAHEGHLMRNCIGTPDIRPWSDLVFSMRDPSGRPHADVVLRDGELWEISGRASSTLKAEYRERVRAFFDALQASSGTVLKWHPKANVTAMRSVYGESYAPAVCVWSADSS